MFKEYFKYDALSLAELIRKKQASAIEVCEAAIERIERLNPGLNAVITPMYDSAMAIARSAPMDGPFAGVPFLLKDLLSACKGVRFTSGSRAYKDYVPDYDSELVKRFKASGVVILGKTNTPEFGLMGITEPELHGATRNPWNPDHSPGGSSGGSAAAVASALTPFASGGDGGGSIRIPSSYCGLFGLKPTRFRTPTGPRHGRVWQGAAVEHVLCRSVRDSAAMLDATQGPDQGAPFATALPERPYLREIEREPGQLRVAFCADSPLGGEVDPECKAAVEDAARLLEQLGHKVEEASPKLDGVALADNFFIMYYGETAVDMETAAEDIGRKVRSGDFEVATRALGQMAECYTARDYANMTHLFDRAARVMGEFHERYDVYMTPTVAGPPPLIGELLPKSYEKMLMGTLCSLHMMRIAKWSGALRATALRILARTPFTQLANYTGQPAMSVPLARHGNGLPCGVQFIARFMDEATLFRLAAQLERARPWAEHLPGLQM